MQTFLKRTKWQEFISFLSQMSSMRFKMVGKVLTRIVLFFFLLAHKKITCFCEGESTYKIHTEADYDACYRLENYNVVC